MRFVAKYLHSAQREQDLLRVCVCFFTAQGYLIHYKRGLPQVLNCDLSWPSPALLCLLFVGHTGKRFNVLFIFSMDLFSSSKERCLSNRERERETRRNHWKSLKRIVFATLRMEEGEENEAEDKILIFIGSAWVRKKKGQLPTTQVEELCSFARWQKLENYSVLRY
jgi:hypothetical protein